MTEFLGRRLSAIWWARHVQLSRMGRKRGLRRRDLLVMVSAALGAAIGLGCESRSLPLRAPPTVEPGLPSPIPTRFVVAPPTPRASPMPPRPIDRLRLAVPWLPADFEPLQDNGEWSRTVLRTLFDPLVVRDAAGSVVPHLAANYQNVDPLTWRFGLREGIRFTGGQLLTAEDVRYSLERAGDAQLGLPTAAWVATLRRVEILDSTTIHVITKEPDPLLPARLVLAPIVPRSYHRQVGERSFAERPVGTGPYRLKDRSNDRLVLEATDSSWRGRPRSRELVMLAMPDAAVRAGALLGREVDFAYDVALSSVRDVSDAGAAVVAGTRLSTATIELGYLTGGPLLDRRVRYALNFAVDKQALVRRELGGFGQIVQGQLVVPGVMGYAPAVRAYPYDPERARALLKDAGVAPGGLALKIETLGGTDQAVAEAVATHLNRIGVPTALEVLSGPVYAERSRRGGRAPLFLLSLSYGQLLDVDEVYQRYLSTAPPESRRFASPEFDELFAKSRTEIDAAARRQSLERLARLFHEEAPVIFLVNESAAHALDPGIGGFARQGDGVLALESLGGVEPPSGRRRP